MLEKNTYVWPKQIRCRFFNIKTYIVGFSCSTNQHPTKKTYNVGLFPQHKENNQVSVRPRTQILESWKKHKTGFVFSRAFHEHAMISCMKIQLLAICKANN